MKDSEEIEQHRKEQCMDEPPMFSPIYMPFKDGADREAEREEGNEEPTTTPVLDKLVDDYYKLKAAVLEFTTAIEGYTELARQPTKTVLEAITQSDKFIEMKNLTL